MHQASSSLSITTWRGPAVNFSGNMSHSWSQAECTELHGFSLLQLSLPHACCRGALHKECQLVPAGAVMPVSPGCRAWCRGQGGCCTGCICCTGRGMGGRSSRKSAGGCSLAAWPCCWARRGTAGLSCSGRWPACGRTAFRCWLLCMALQGLHSPARGLSTRTGRCEQQMLCTSAIHTACCLRPIQDLEDSTSVVHVPLPVHLCSEQPNPIADI